MSTPTKTKKRDRSRPAPVQEKSRRGPARGAMRLWAWRLFRREWRQQLLVLALITVAVAATILGAAVATTAPSQRVASVFGTAGELVDIPGSDRDVTAGVAAMRQRFGPVDVIENQTLSTGSVQAVQLRAQDPRGPFGAPTLALVSGRYPAGPGQVAVTSTVASLYNLRVGGVWHQGGKARRVVGLVENPSNLLDEFALVAPGQVRAPTEVTVLFNGVPNVVARFRFPRGSVAQQPPYASGFSPSTVVLGLATLGLIFIGLLAVAGFTVMGQRRLRALGMLSSLGATDRDIRRVMVTNGAIVGVVGTLLGAAVGLAGWFAYVPHLSVSAGHRIGAFSLPWGTIVTAMILAVVTAILAARRPARSLARVPVMTALAGRP
ncbi:MAG: ABC transporter permease, partial [Streptosporangiaceae bacterium]